MMKYRLKQLIAGFCALALLCTELPLARAAGETINLDLMNHPSETIVLNDDISDIQGNDIVSVVAEHERTESKLTWAGVPTTLQDCEYNFTEGPDTNTVYAQSKKNTSLWFTPIGVWISDNKLIRMTTTYPNSSTKDFMYLEQGGKSGSFYIKEPVGNHYESSDRDNPVQEPYYIKFNKNGVYFDKGLTPESEEYSFWILRKDTNAVDGPIPGYTFVTTASDVRGDCLIAAEKDGRFYLVYPDGSRTNQRNSIATYTPATKTTTVTFTAQQVGTTDVQIGDTTYRITVSGLWEAEPSSNLTKPSDQRIVLEPKESFSCYRGDGVSTGSEVSWTASGVATAEISTGVDSIVKNCNTNWMTPAEFCLYQFTASGAGYIISGTTENGKKVYLNLTANPNTIHSTTEQAVFSVKSANGKFEFRASDDTQLFLNQHKNFNGVDQDASKRVSQFVLYTPEKDTNLDSDELPGYRRVTEIEAGQSYLIAAYSDGTFYFVFPSDSTNGDRRNLHVAKAQKTYLSNATKITFTAQRPGMAVATIGGTKYTIVVRDPNAVSAAKGVAVGSTVEKLRLSKNATFDVRMPKNFTGNPTGNDSSIATATVNDRIATILAIQAGTTTFDFGGQKLEVEVVDTGSSDGYLIDYYIEEVTHTKAYYTILKQDGSFSEFAEVKQQEVLWLYVQGSGKSLHFFGAPEPNAALTILGATNSAGNYKKLDDTDPEKTEFYQGTDTIRYNPGGANVTQEAINKGCFGGFSFTLNHSISSNLTFRSEYLPIVTAKPIRIEERDAAGNVTSTPYVDGEPVKAGSWVIFGIEIRVFDKDNITYDSITLGNSLDDQTLDFAPVMNETTFHNGDNQIILTDKKADGTTIEVPVTVNKKMNADGSVTYGVELPCQMKAEDATKFEQGAALENRISMEYTYTAKYQSSGESALCNSSTAVAVLTISLADRLTHMNLSLGSTIGANVYFPVEEGTNGAEQSEWLKTSDSSNKSFVGPYYVAFGITDAEGKLITHIGDPIPFASGVAAVIGKGDDAKTCRRFTVDISPMDMTQEISVFVTDKDGNRVSGIQKLKVNDYANALLDEKNKDSLITEWQINHDTTCAYADGKYGQLKELVQALQTYGTYLQVFAAYHTKSLPTQNSTPVFRTWDSDPYENIGEGEAPYTKAEESDGVNFSGLSLVVSEKSVAMRVYFNYNSEQHGRLKTVENQYILENSTGTKFQFTDAGAVVHNDNGYYVEVPDITSTWLSNIYRIEITTDLDPDENGKSHKATSSIELSALTYAYALSTQSEKVKTENAALCNLVHALYDYNRAAVDYFGSNQAISN